MLKEKSFKFKELFAHIIKGMNDEQAGIFIKGACEYVFHKHELKSEDAAVSIALTVFKSEMEANERDRENGKRGALASAEKSKRSVNGVICMTEIAFSTVEENKERSPQNVAKK